MAARRKTEDRFARRRRALLRKLGDGLLLLPTAPERLRNGDVHHEYRPGSDFLYLTGFEEPSSVLALQAGKRGEPHVTMFVRPKDPEREIWDGRRAGVQGVQRHHAANDAHAIQELWQRLPDMLLEHDRLYYTLGRDPEMDAKVLRACAVAAARRRKRNVGAHPAIVDPGPSLATMRLLKDRDEVAAMQRAADATVAGHRAAMMAARPGMHEYEVQAVMERVFREHGSPRNGYPSIVASGANACILHYVENDRRMRRDDLLLIDAGAEVDGYTADITRTFPVSGRFTPAQRAVYEVVRRAEEAGIRAVRAGRAWDGIHRTCVRMLTRGLVELGVLRGEVDRLVKKQAYKPYYMHGTSHWLGLDVHDVGPYEDDAGKSVKLAPGAVLTVEPGLYFDARDRKVPRELRGIGVRIEDDVLVTAGAPRVLTAALPKHPDEVEALCAGQDAVGKAVSGKAGARPAASRRRRRTR